MGYKERLKQYLEEDTIYTEYKNGKCDMSDFDKFCIEHCKDIECLLNEVEEQKEVIQIYETLLKTNIEENKQLKEQLETSEKARKESIRILGEYRHYTLPTEEQNRENEDIVDKAYNNLILKQDIDKGE